MIKGFTKQGYVAYKCTREEITKFGGLGICDECNSAEDGYLVPVLNRYLCPKCFSEFVNTSIIYLSDLWFQERYINYFERYIPITGYVDQFEV